LVTNEEKRGTVTLFHSAEESVELAEIAADARIAGRVSELVRASP